ncbi:hypothetical protein PC116_g27374 [Phytophthora cactorum]|nr:hypothetical protein PC116_g27374 [Phytophthora cactorum]
MSLELKRLELGKEATLVNTLNRILDNNQIVGVLDECGALQVSFGVRDYSTRLGACDGTRLNTVVESTAARGPLVRVINNSSVSLQETLSNNMEKLSSYISQRDDILRSFLNVCQERSGISQQEKTALDSLVDEDRTLKTLYQEKVSVDQIARAIESKARFGFDDCERELHVEEEEQQDQEMEAAV